MSHFAVRLATLDVSFATSRCFRTSFTFVTQRSAECAFRRRRNIIITGSFSLMVDLIVTMIE